ncbi:colicin E3/pyocin S6 family cytotoxin [Streptomyces sp. NPDC056144]|uniref:colicin E3/pyocin S6 family cytotoxin n=1 Tax=unclassified Streptomyces TaxID=2593676 RepID=UPI0035DC7365
MRQRWYKARQLAPDGVRPRAVCPPSPGRSSRSRRRPFKGAAGRRARWKDAMGSIYEHDRQHDTVEVYNENGKLTSGPNRAVP